MNEAELGLGLCFRPEEKNPADVLLNLMTAVLETSGRSDLISIPDRLQLSSSQGQHFLSGGCSPSNRAENKGAFPPDIETRLDFNQHITPVVNCFNRPLLK